MEKRLPLKLQMSIFRGLQVHVGVACVYIGMEIMYTLHSKFTHAVIYNCVCSSSTHTHIHTVTHHTEPTLTVDNLTVVLISVQDDMNYVLSYLHIPSSKQEQLQQQYSRGQVNTARADYIIDHHPSPSWMMVANALWRWRAAGALEMVQTLYLKGEPCAHSCRSEGRIILSISDLQVH